MNGKEVNERRNRLWGKVNFAVGSDTIQKSDNDGDSDTSPMLGNPYCGDSLPPSRISSSNHLFFRFISDFYGTATGFRLEYNATSKNATKYKVLRKFRESRNLLLYFSHETKINHYQKI